MHNSKKQTPTPELKLLFTPPTNSITISNGIHATQYLRSIWDTSLIPIQEQVYIVFLNNAQKVICWRCLHTGGIQDCAVDIRIIFGLACGCLASAVLLAHNHPSGQLAPSNSDLLITKQLKTAGEIMGIKLIDHIILTQNESYSILHQMVIDDFEGVLQVHNLDNQIANPDQHDGKS